MKVKARYEVVVEMDVDDKFEVLKEEGEVDRNLMYELEETIAENSLFRKVRIGELCEIFNKVSITFPGVYSADNDSVMLEC